MLKSKLLFVFFLSLPLLGLAQEKSYPEHFGDIFNSDKFLLGKQIFKGDVSLSTSKLTFTEAEGELIEFYRLAAKINFHINPFKDFYLKNTFYFDLIDYEEAPVWLSNYFYQIGVYNWRAKTFSYGYENYQPNRFRNAEVDFWTNMKRGSFFISYNFELNKTNNPKNPFFLDETSKLSIIPLVRAQVEYVNADNEKAGNFKPVLGTNIRYVIFKNIYIETGLFYYPITESKLPWDADYTYGFGIFDWRAFKINFSYGNWIANRFPWSEKEMEHSFMNGEFTLSVNYAW
jgi:hypothetical protein